MADSLQYQEPSIVAILILSSFFLLLNIIDWLLDRFVYCGLLGQILLGTAWGTPAAGWLSTSIEQGVTQLGYLGLLLLVFEGGLHSSISSLRANFVRSAAVALTGILLPVGLSFLLTYLANATLLQSFAAGAALSSTSLGTTLTVLRASGLQHTRLGTVLTSAALLDDVVGLVMVQLIQNIGNSGEEEILAAVLRPLGASLGLVLVTFLLCKLCIQPCTKLLLRLRDCENEQITLHRVLYGPGVSLVLQTAALISSITVASYAGCSNLFAAYLVGASVSWWYDTFGVEVSGIKSAKPTALPQVSSAPQEPAVDDAGDENNSRAASQPMESTPAQPPDSTPVSPRQESERENSPASTTSSSPSPASADMFDRYYSETLSRFLKPCFFASIGFALPIRSMFLGNVVWRGLVYSLLMAFGKLATGAWLVRVSLPFPAGWKAIALIGCSKQSHNVKVAATAKSRAQPRSDQKNDGSTDLTTPSVPADTAPADRPQAKTTSMPNSLYPALLLGTAMIPRGEIGFLIAAIAQNRGLFGSVQDSSLLLIVNWAIFACTAAGPVLTGLLARRVRALEQKRQENSAEESPLGTWGQGSS